MFGLLFFIFEITAMILMWLYGGRIALRRLGVFIGLIVVSGAALAHSLPPDPLKGVKVPDTPGLTNGGQRIVVDRQAAVALGKALFWDISVGSDGVACATCHFHAGADRRTRNQLNSGRLRADAATSHTFETTASGASGGPDHPLRASDFPFRQFSDPTSRYSEVTFDSDDVVGSAGTFLGEFQGIDNAGDGNDHCASVEDDIFHLGALNSRRVTDRNTPTVINAAYNFRNFWDGRANNLFNGESPFGARDPNAGVWVVKNGRPAKIKMLLENAALASQAVAPPLNDVEMTCMHRTFPELGRKLLPRRPLEFQEVHAEDSVLGELRAASDKGLDTTYQTLIEKAFAKRFWAGGGDFGLRPDGGAYRQIEANFAFFFGLAIQLYEQTLISDQSPFDGERDADNVPIAFNEQQKRGLDVFMKAHCFNCHIGPALTSAAHPKVFGAKGRKYFSIVNREGMSEELDGVGVAKTLFDTGFMVTSVSSPERDPGLGGRDPFGNPLSFAQQYLDALADPAQTMADPIDVVACELAVPFIDDFSADELTPDPQRKGYCRGFKGYARVPKPDVIKAELAKIGQGRLPVLSNGAFKIPGLRNIELTGPYMHNGGMKSLEEVVEFYDRGGNHFNNPQHVETLVFPQSFSAQNKADLVAFLKTLTDERVRWERAPFDHPALPVAEGHAQGVSPLDAGYAADRIVQVPAVGKNGRTPEQGPLRPFEYYLQP